jgi:hypothetical protein
MKTNIVEELKGLALPTKGSKYLASHSEDNFDEFH